MISQKDAFDFVDGGREFNCSVEAPHEGRPEAWWWFTVEGDETRYAPFRASVGDTQESVRSGILAYYEDHCTRRGWERWRSRSGRARPQ
jgi:hypothetical protein